MEKIIIEVLRKQGRVQERHSFLGGSVKIGRGYSNDVILSDPFVSPDHVQISPQENGWKIEDLNSKNGIRRKNDPVPQKQFILSSGEEFCIGKTTLRVVSTAHPVPPAQKMALPAFKEKSFSNSYGLHLTLFLGFFIFFSSQYLNNSEEVEVEKLFAMTLLVFPLAIVWAGVWAFSGKVMRQKHFFNSQLQTTMAFLIAVVLLDELFGYVEYNLHNTSVLLALKIIGFGLLTEYTLSKHLFLATVLDRRKIRKVSGSIVFGIISGTLFIYYAITSDFDPNPQYSLTLKPPFMKIKPNSSLESFFKDNDNLFKKIK